MWHTVTTARDYTGRGLSRIREALRDGTLTGHQTKPGGTWRIERPALDAWMRGEIPAPQAPASRRRAS